MILAIDVGNTNIVLGCMEKESIVFRARYSTDRAKTEDEYALMMMDMFNFHKIQPNQIEGAIISSVVPELKTVFQLAVKEIIGKRPLTVSNSIKADLKIRLDDNSQLGSDLLVNAVAACAKYPKPIMIFDMGTATTLSVIDTKGNYIGGMIMPGLRLSVDALSAETSQLPRISLDPPKQLIGTSTVNSMKAGAVYGSAAMMDGVIGRIEEELGETFSSIIATGGLISDILPYCKRKIIYDSNLMLEGLHILYEKNK